MEQDRQKMAPMIRDLQGQIVAFQPLDMLQLEVFVAEVCVGLRARVRVRVCVCVCVCVNGGRRCCATNACTHTHTHIHTGGTKADAPVR